MKNARDVSVLVVGLMTLLPQVAFAQDLGPQPTMAPPAYVQPAAPAQPVPPLEPMAPPPPGNLAEAPPGATPVAQPQAYTQEQIDQLVAPIALYPDGLVSQILMASTYPLEIVEAQRWQQQNPQVQGPALETALQQEPWDPSVKSLVPFPQVLSMMNNNLQWTEQLGDAFLASQPVVMGEIQGLRQKAEAAGNLRSTPQQTVQQQQGEVIIQPANPQVVYVPYYNPQVVYGPWPWVAYPPYYFVEPPGYVAFGLFGFGVGIAVADWFWGWGHWDWFHHSMFIDDHRFAFLNRGVDPHFHGGVWAHDVDHRHGVPYRAAGVRAQYQGAASAARSNYRGYFNAGNRGAAANANVRSAAVNGAARPAGNSVGTNRGATPETRNATPEARSFTGSTTQHSAATGATASHTTAATTHQTRSAPMFESFSRGSDVRTQSARGATSRASMSSASRPAAQPQRSSGGNAGGARGGNEQRH